MILLKFVKNLIKNVLGSHDYLLHKIGTFLKDDGTPYKVYTPFFRMASK